MSLAFHFFFLVGFHVQFVLFSFGKIIGQMIQSLPTGFAFMT